MQAKALVPIAAGAALVLLGVVLGTWIGGSWSHALAAAPEADAQTDAERELLEEMRAMQDQLATLTDEVRAMRGDRGRRPTSLATGLEHVPIAAAEPPATREPVPSSSPGPEADASDEPAGEPNARDRAVAHSLETILARLETLEATQRMALSAGGVGLSKLTLEIPSGMPVRDFLQALKNSGNDEDVKRAHLFWDTERVRSTYGTPDEVADRGDYVEWIYKLSEEGTQFDFHFVNGLAVEAH